MVVSIIFFIFVNDFSFFFTGRRGLPAGLVPVAVRTVWRVYGAGFRDIVKGRLLCALFRSGIGFFHELRGDVGLLCRWMFSCDVWMMCAEWLSMRVFAVFLQIVFLTFICCFVGERAV